MLPIALCAIFAFASAQKWINFNTLNANSDMNTIVDNENVSIYLTASSDASTFLDLILFSTGGLNRTASEVMKSARHFMNSDLLQPWIVQGPVNVSTSLSTEQVNALTGSIYITTSNQAYDKNFMVYDLTMEQLISTIEPQSTIVILNSQYGVKPYISSYFSFWQQRITEEVNLYRGPPSDDVVIRSSAIFRNPFQTINSVAHVTSVENFNLNLPIFYFEVLNGVSFDISPKFVNINGTKMSNAFTTGFFMKSEKTTEADVELHPVTSLSSNYLGVNYIGEDIPVNGYVNVAVNTSSGSTIQNQFSGSTVSYWQTNLGDPLTIKSYATNAGQFYIQYYVIPGRALETTMAPNGASTTTSRPMSTTTQSSGRIHIVITILWSFFGLQFS